MNIYVRKLLRPERSSAAWRCACNLIFFFFFSVRPQDPRLTGPTSVVIGEELVLVCTTDSGGVKYYYFYKGDDPVDVSVNAPYRKPMADAGDAGDYYCFVIINNARSYGNSNTVTVKGE